jgi:hypothetical protein
MRAPLAHPSGDSLELVQQQHFVGGWCSCPTFRYSWTTSVQVTCCFQDARPCNWRCEIVFCGF